VTHWYWLLLACAVAWLTKFSGYLVPLRWLQSTRMNHVAAALTVGLLAALTTINTVASGQGVALDARIGALLVAALALWLRLSFLLVVIAGTLVAAGLRMIGMP